MVAQSESVPSTAANSGPCGTQRPADAPGAAGSSGNMGATSPVAMVIPQAQSVLQAQAALAGGVSSTPAQATGNATRSQPSVTTFQDYQRSPVVDTWHQLQHKQLATPPAPSPALPLSRITNAPQWWTLGINSSTSNWHWLSHRKNATSTLHTRLHVSHFCDIRKSRVNMKIYLTNFLNSSTFIFWYYYM